MKKVKKLYKRYEMGGDNGDPVNPNPITPMPATQLFPEYYQQNQTEFDAADQAARSYMTDWFSQRAQDPQYAKASGAMKEYLEKSGRGVYLPEGTEITGLGENADNYGFANIPSYRLSMDQTEGDIQLQKEPFSSPTSPGEINSNPLLYNTAYYTGKGGKMPTTQLEEQLHLASNYGEYADPTHSQNIEEVSKFINPKIIKRMGYLGMKGNENYLGDVEEFYPRLMSARRIFGLKPLKKYDVKEMGIFLDKGYNDILKDKFTEDGQREHLIDFYKQIGYPTPSAEFTKGASEEEIQKAKEEAARRFMMANQILAMNENSTEPSRGRMGGYLSKNNLQSQVIRKFNKAYNK